MFEEDDIDQGVAESIVQLNGHICLAEHGLYVLRFSKDDNPEIDQSISFDQAELLGILHDADTSPEECMFFASALQAIEYIELCSGTPNVIGELHLDDITEEGCVERVEQFIEDFETRSGIKVNLPAIDFDELTP